MKRLLYTGVGHTPSIFVHIVHAVTGRRMPFCMLVDTGASHTCIPEKYAAFFGHDNKHHQVKAVMAKGIGGESKGYEHTVDLELIDPSAKILSKLISPWKARKIPVWFLRKMDMEMGVIGRDIISRWAGLEFRMIGTKKKPTWEIVIGI